MLTDWLMVIITAIYVVATIFICVYNGKSAKAATTQTEEMKKQFFLTNRPILSVEIVYIKRTFFALRFTNNGNQTAFNTIFDIDQRFIDSLPEKKFRDLLNKSKSKIKNIGVGQSYDLFFGSNKYLALENKLTVAGQIIYSGNDSSTYAEDFNIDAENYAPFLTVDSDLDDIKKELKNQTEAIKRLSNTLEHLTTTEKELIIGMANDLIEENKEALTELSK